MRICFLCNEYPPGPHGGIGTSTQNLARAFKEAGHDARVIGLYAKTYPAPDYEEDRGVRVWRFRRRGFRFGWIEDRHRLYRTVRQWAKTREIDLIDAPDWEGPAAGWLRLPVPVVARLCGSQTYFASELAKPVKRTMYLLESASLRRADFWCSKSHYTADRTQNVFKLDRTANAVIYNPVPIPESVPAIQRSTTKVVFTGTLVQKKGIVSLVKAWPRVRAACRQAELHIYGKDAQATKGCSMRASLESRLHRHIDSVSFHGHVDRAQLTAALMQAAVAVFPSYAEAFANAPLEAMACACPTIYSCRGSGRELIDHGRTGLLVDPDQPEEIADAVIRLITDRDKARELGQSGRDRVHSDFSIAKLLEQNHVFYETCLNDFSRAGSG